MHEEENPGTPLGPGTPVCPHAAAERIGISPVGRWYAATLDSLVEEGALEHKDVHPRDAYQYFTIPPSEDIGARSRA